ncbi:UNVERIFIED_CONTAM: hypothetical protein Sangu_1600400 [Sesamum angustifolium]|uniref:Uncharacterized protein n=1 Tax=Sesamum angustifolium TaxID=2727405 RepID=A0AAW2MS35_9LAMI
MVGRPRSTSNRNCHVQGVDGVVVEQKGRFLGCIASKATSDATVPGFTGKRTPTI